MLQHIVATFDAIFCVVSAKFLLECEGPQHGHHEDQIL